MPEFIIGYRIYGPVKIQVSGEIGNAILRKKSGESPVDAILEFRQVSASNKEAAEDLANKEYRGKAQSIINILSYIVEDGFILGESREVKKQDRNQIYTSSHTVLKPFVLKIADKIMKNSPDILNEDEDLYHSLTWYSIGQGTYTPEDRLIAYWIGLEAQVENQSTLSEKELEKYHDLTDLIDTELEDFDVLRDRAKSLLGLLKKESHKVAVKRFLRERFDVGDDGLDGIDDIWGDRGGIVHQGIQVENASEKADVVQRWLRKSIDRQLSSKIDEIVDFDLPIEFTDEAGEIYTPSHATTAPEEWLRVVFDEEIGRVLSIDEIQLRAYPIFQDIQQVARIEVILDKFVGWGKPLQKQNDQEYLYSPPPDWFSPEVDAVMNYLNGAGEVTSEIISHNIPNERNDVNSSVEETESVLGSLCDLSLVERSNEYYHLTIDGEACLEGRIDPRELS
jgi:hypothetical protein